MIVGVPVRAGRRTVQPMGPVRSQRREHAIVVVLVGAIAAFGAIGLWAASGLEYNDNIYAPWQWAIGASALVVGGVFAWQAPRHPMGFVLLAAAASVWSTAGGSAILGRLTAPTWYARPLSLVGVSGWVLERGLLLAAAPFVYPNGVGRSVARRWFAAAVATAVLATAAAQAIAYGTWDFATGQPAEWTQPAHDALPWLFRVSFAAAVAVNIELVWRVLHFEPSERRRHRVMGTFAVALAAPGIIDLAQAAGWGVDLGVENLEFYASIALPLVLAYGALRSRVLGFEVVVRRTLVYATTALIAAVVYALVVAAFAAVLADGVGAGPIVAAGIIAIAIHPVWTFADAFVRRRLFGDRDDPYQALARLGRRLESSASTDESLRLVADSVRESLRVPFVAIDLVLHDGTTIRSTSRGEDPGTTAEYPIVHAGLVVGSLRVAARSLHERFLAHEEVLLADLARAAGPVARSLQLVAELQRARELLVLAREEERRRLRRDLHDGLGPTIASVALGIEAASNRLAHDPEMVALLHALDEELQQAIVDIRKLVYGLRPPALDDLGLLPALRHHADNLAGRSSNGSVRISITSSGDLERLPAAVEVAAFRIALEAMTNVVRHAGASSCSVRFEPGATLEIIVEDDGCGIDRSAPSGVGVASMRERAQELGGDVVFERRAPNGAIVRAILPLAGVPA